MSLDSWFDPPSGSQPRHRNGRFAQKAHSAPEVSLGGEPVAHGAPERDVLRYAVVTHGVRWTTATDRQHVIDEYAPEFVVAVTASGASSYRRHPDDAEHQRWSSQEHRTVPELARVLLHEEDAGYYASVLVRPDITPAMAHYAAHHPDASIARTAIAHPSMTMNALLALRDRYVRKAARAQERHAAEGWPPAQEHWSWLHQRERATAAFAERRLMGG